MSLYGKRVKIHVDEPWDLSGTDYFGKIIGEKEGNKLLVKLTDAIKGDKITSSLMEISPRYENETFKPLKKQQEVTVGGALVKENSEEFDYVIIGTVTLE